jgi:hypothetical protein
VGRERGVGGGVRRRGDVAGDAQVVELDRTERLLVPR